MHARPHKSYFMVIPQALAPRVPLYPLETGGTFSREEMVVGCFRFVAPTIYFSAALALGSVLDPILNHRGQLGVIKCHYQLVGIRARTV